MRWVSCGIWRICGGIVPVSRLVSRYNSLSVCMLYIWDVIVSWKRLDPKLSKVKLEQRVTLGKGPESSLSPRFKIVNWAPPGPQILVQFDNSPLSRVTLSVNSVKYGRSKTAQGNSPFKFGFRLLSCPKYLIGPNSSRWEINQSQSTVVPRTCTYVQYAGLCRKLFHQNHKLHWCYLHPKLEADWWKVRRSHNRWKRAPFWVPNLVMSAHSFLPL